MSRTISVCSWDAFQHYKDRDPPWIKLHRDLLSSEKWVMANDPQRLSIITVMLMAARHDNQIPANPQYIQRAANLDAEPDLDWLVSIGFCVYAEHVATQKPNSAEQPVQVKWNSRYVSAQLREAVLKRDGHKCLVCSVKADLEIDHIVPISKGGTGDINNLQTLCRSCNRTKRTRTKDARQVLRRDGDERSSEGEREAEAEQSRAEQSRAEQRESRADISAAAPPEHKASEKVSRGTEPEESEWFLDFKLAYPDRAGDQGWRKAERAGKARMREGHFPREFIAGARRYAKFCAATQKLGTEFVKQAASFLGPDKPFLLPWTLPTQPETAMEEIQRLNGGSHAPAGRVLDADPSATGLVPLFGALRR